MLDRYRDIVDDWDAFIGACARPLPRVVWANPLRCPEDIAARVIARCPEAVPIDWHAGAWRLPHDARPGRWPEYRLGWLHGQEEAALGAVPALDVEPGMSVLDMCASPGNKTAQIAVSMGDVGSIVANERSNARLAGLRFNLERLGITCAAVTRGDATRYQGRDAFDRVLVDAPCTCEGTARKSGAAGREDIEDHRRIVVQVQRALLRKAVRLVRPGGLVVYSTCTFAPEENEAVVDAVKDAIEVEPVDVPDGLHARPGLAEWDGRRFREDVGNCLRIWPHHNDSGGFFVARIRKR